uniref:DNA repair protein-like n=1 Tax=Karlodinium veneficum TaxID=407301 RepID=E8Z768_KARVE|nr:DNA repair protein-like [Karlodinium veneficum]
MPRSVHLHTTDGWHCFPACWNLRHPCWSWDCKCKYLEPAWDLRDWLLAPQDEATQLLSRAWSACAAKPSTALDLAKSRKHGGTPVPLGSLGAVVSGSLSGKFMEVAGPPGVGKTQFCLHIAALAAANGGEVFWLDSENTFAPPRLLEVLEAVCIARSAGNIHEAEAEALAALARVRKKSCTSLKELHNIAAELEQRAAQGVPVPALVIVDSVAAIARNDGDASEPQRVQIPRRQAALSAIAGLFKRIVASTNQSLAPPGVVVTNQVAGDPRSGGSRVTLGHVWHHAVNWRLVLSHLPPGDPRGYGLKESAVGSKRFLHVEKSPCSPPITIEFAICRNGLSEICTIGDVS